ncbi:MAG: 50S ribosomal protein L18Ae [Acidilobaceae archaeon]
MSNAKTYLVEGQMLISHDKSPEWRKFRLYVRAVKPESAIEKVYSQLGSRHKLKRSHIKIISIREVELDEVEDLRILKLANLDKVIR